MIGGGMRSHIGIPRKPIISDPRFESVSAEARGSQPLRHCMLQSERHGEHRIKPNRRAGVAVQSDRR
jgi:hypothetical protein